MKLVSLFFLILLSAYQWLREPVSPPCVSNTPNWGLTNCVEKSHIQAEDAWKIEGTNEVVVAVIDSGIDAKHPLLKDKLWKSPKNPSVYGWDFVTNRPNPTDTLGHGTHVAGTIGASVSEMGHIGVSNHVKIMVINYYSSTNPGSVNLQNTVKSIQYAVDNGAKIINYSSGGNEFSENEYLAIKYAEEKGVLFISAAGNEGSNSDMPENYYYPSAYRLPNMISVAATDIHNDKTEVSNWGKRKVDVTAPGKNIFSTLPNRQMGYMSGTSQATAFVTGIAAMILSKNPNLTPEQVKKIIVGSVDKFSKLSTVVASGGRVNAYKALLYLEK